MTLALPKGAEILHGDAQNHGLFVWAEIDTNETELEVQRVIFVGTGFKIPVGAVHVNSFMMPPYVFHLYKLL